MISPLTPYVVVATKGRAKETFRLLDSMATQTLAVAHVVVVGSTPEDIAGLDQHPLVLGGRATLKISQPGLTIQRNIGLDVVAGLASAVAATHWFVAFFDDDFRPRRDWLEACALAFEQTPDLAGLGGTVLADGVTGQGLSETSAQAFLDGTRPPQRHAWSGTTRRAVQSLYGCNMAYRGTWAEHQRFDELLPLYGWQEDVDYSHRALALGTLAHVPECVGVHMGVQGGRTSGLRFGYSQISNPLFLVRKRTMPAGHAVTLMLRNLVSNLVHTLMLSQEKDFKGRLIGNAHALLDIVRMRCHPMKVLEF